MFGANLRFLFYKDASVTKVSNYKHIQWRSVMLLIAAELYNQSFFICNLARENHDSEISLLD